MFVVPGSSVVVKVRAWKKQMFIDSLAETSIYWYIYIYVYIYIKITNCVWWEYCWPCFLDSTKWCDSDCEENTYHKKLACKVFSCHYQCHKLRKIFTGLTYKLLLRFKVISGVYRSFIPNKTMLTKYCLTPGELYIHWVRQYLVNLTDLVGMSWMLKICEIFMWLAAILWSTYWYY